MYIRFLYKFSSTVHFVCNDSIIGDQNFGLLYIVNAKFSTYFFNVLVGAAFYNFSDEEIILRCIIFTASFYGVTFHEE